MDKTASTWSTPREMVQVVLAPQRLKRTLSVALTYLTALLVSNFGLLSATRRPTVQLTAPSGR